MSTGGLFTLITNDGKQDRMLMATQLLSRRLKRITAARRAAGGGMDATPTIADIEKTHVLFMNAHFKPFAAFGFEYGKVRPQQGTAQLGSEITFSIPQFGDFFHDMVLHVTLGSPTQVSGTTLDFRYVDFVGHRLLKRVAFEVNGNPLDEYNSDTYNMYYQFQVPDHKQLGWKRCVGQEVAQNGWVNYDPLVAGHREARAIYNGPQTKKALADVPPLDLWVPLLFWFNKDPRLSIPSVSIPYGQRFINITFASQSEISAVDAGVVNTNITTCELYINNIFVNPEVHEIYIRRIGFNLVRVHRLQSVNLNKDSDDVLLQSLKWPVETMYVGFRPTANKVLPDAWWRFSSVTTNSEPTFTLMSDGAGGAPAVAAELTVDVNTYTPPVSSVTISAHGVPIYNTLSNAFYNSYIPTVYGGTAIRTPDDVGALMIPFNLYPGAYQPSGHLNISRAREFYLKYVSNTISSSNTADLVIVVSALNFLLITDGSAVLRYTT